MSSTITRLDLAFGDCAESDRPPSISPLARLRFWFQVAKERRQLASLSDYALSDIGISRADAMGEYRRDFWDVPKCR